MFDAIACEPHFVDHLAPVWNALPEETRGRFLVDVRYEDRARSKGLEPEPVDSRTLRLATSAAPHPPGGRKALVASIGDQKVGRRLGYGDFARLEHGIGQDYIGNLSASYAGGPGNDDASLVLVPNAYAANRWQRSYPSAQVEVVGCPKLDELPARDGGGSAPPVVAISFHWPAQHIAPEAGTTVSHYSEKLGELAKRYTVIGHRHPNWVNRGYGDLPGRLYQKLGIEIVSDFDEVCRRADLYICDNSSTLYEFAATGRPVLVLNSPMYRKNVEHGLRFWEAAKVGINVFCPCDLVSLAGEALKDDADAKRDREAALDIVYAYRSGAAERAAAALVRWACQEVAVAA